MDVYAENILEHYRDPRLTGSGEGADVTHKEDNPACGDEITVHLFVEDDTLKKIEWGGMGCAISQAGMSMLAEEIEGMQSEEILKLKKDDIYALFGVPIGPRRFKCALICLHTVKNAIRKNSEEEPQSWIETVEIIEEN